MREASEMYRSELERLSGNRSSLQWEKSLEGALEKWRRQLDEVVSSLEMEMKRNWVERRPRLLFLLYREKVVCEAVVLQLESLMRPDHLPQGGE
jgi:hypothetical protein